MSPSTSPRPALDRLQRGAFIVGMAALLLCLGGALRHPSQFFQAYLVAYLFWIGIALGCLAIVMLHHLTGGAWGLVIRRLLESAAMTLPLMALLFVPLFFGLHDLYSWARPPEVAASATWPHQSPYLTRPFFVMRTVVYFAIWIGIAWLLNRWSRAQDPRVEPLAAGRLRTLSGPGLVLYGLTVTFASIDWAMSLEPRWFSTIYGMLAVIGQWLTGLAFVIVILALLAHRQPLSEVLSPTHVHDLGNLLLAFILLWAYIAFSQYLLIWSGNLPEEIPWYVRRTAGGWQWLALVLILGHFALPFLLLLFRDIKRRVGMLSAVAAGIVLMHLVDQFWMVAPAFRQEGLATHWMDVAAPIGIGGIWMAAFVWHLNARPLLPQRDVLLRDALKPGAFGHG